MKETIVIHKQKYYSKSGGFSAGNISARVEALCATL
jgi:hypothetical protein